MVAMDVSAERAVTESRPPARAGRIASVDFDEVADELYSLPPAEFTATRNAREREAKAAGDAELAGRIRRLGKPNTAAWLANQLVRERPDEVRPLVELGAGLREATAKLSGDQLRELSKQQHQLVYALVQQAKRLASRKVSEDTARALEDTLHAALADPAAADQLLTGRLTSPLSRTGFGPSDAEPAPAAAEPAAAAAGAAGESGEAAERRRAAQLERVRREEQQARSAAKEAAAARDQARQVADRAGRLVSEATATLERLRAELDQATAAQSDAERDQRRARTQLDKAERAARDAERQADNLAARLAQLGG